ncbi:MAG TPA: Tm-1-like ATP-binding domain-containing protein [Spirochaetota bacterium]|nr:Tm-1-like ATP-binding domain-containing protein [Spirochaetota bacterium]
MKTIAVVGTLDTKGEECELLKDSIEKRGFNTLIVDVGILGEPFFKPDITGEDVAIAGGASIGDLRAERDRGKAVRIMGKGMEKILPELFAQGRIQGVIALGGGGGTSIATSGMRALPFGVPKVMVSTLAGRDVSGYVGIKDIVMVPSIVDISGINRISREVILRAAAAVCGMAEVEVEDAGEKTAIAATMFGNTTPCVGTAREILEAHRYEVLVFGCTGTSGKIMENLIESGHIAGVLDITTTELADELAGGVLSAGAGRLESAGAVGIPQVVVPGCLDMVNFWEPASIPETYRGRKFYRHNPNVTLMRTSIDENRRLGKIISEKLNRSTGPVRVLIPLKGLSMIDAPGGFFWWPEADRALFESLEESLRPDIRVSEMDNNINDPEFAVECARTLIDMMNS